VNVVAAMDCQVSHLQYNQRIIMSELTHLSYKRQNMGCLQHKDAMSPKPDFEKIAKIQRSYVPLYGHMTFVLLTSARTI